MARYTRVGETDDPFFIERVDRILRRIAATLEPHQLWLVQIDNWFDHKWLRFSGIGTVDFPLPALGVGEHGALEEFWQDRLTFPPFAPNRVLGQWSFVRQGDSYVEKPLFKLPHSFERQSSDANLQRRVQDFADSAVFIWYSSNSVANGRNSLMVYAVGNGKTMAWFASLVRENDWELRSTKGVSREQVLQFLNETS